MDLGRFSVKDGRGGYTPAALKDPRFRRRCTRPARGRKLCAQVEARTTLSRPWCLSTLIDLEIFRIPPYRRVDRRHPKVFLVRLTVPLAGRSDSAIRRRKKRKKIFEQPQSCSKANSYPKIRLLKSKLTETASTALIFSFSFLSAVHCSYASLLPITGL